jgi:hypothetical protein
MEWRSGYAAYTRGECTLSVKICVIISTFQLPLELVVPRYREERTMAPVRTQTLMEDGMKRHLKTSDVVAVSMTTRTLERLRLELAEALEARDMEWLTDVGLRIVEAGFSVIRCVKDIPLHQPPTRKAKHAS